MKKDFCGNCGKVINGFIYGPWYDKSCGKCVRKSLKEEEICHVLHIGLCSFGTLLLYK